MCITHIFNFRKIIIAEFNYSGLGFLMVWGFFFVMDDAGKAGVFFTFCTCPSLGSSVVQQDCLCEKRLGAAPYPIQPVPVSSSRISTGLSGAPQFTQWCLWANIFKVEKNIMHQLCVTWKSSNVSKTALQTGLGRSVEKEGEAVLQVPEQRFSFSPWSTLWWQRLLSCSLWRTTLEQTSHCNSCRSPQMNIPL